MLVTHFATVRRPSAHLLNKIAFVVFELIGARSTKSGDFALGVVVNITVGLSGAIAEAFTVGFHQIFSSWRSGFFASDGRRDVIVRSPPVRALGPTLPPRLHRRGLTPACGLISPSGPLRKCRDRSPSTLLATYAAALGTPGPRKFAPEIV